MTRSAERVVDKHVDRWARRVDVLLLLSIAGLHVAWAHGRSWPLPDREILARNVLGVESAEGTTKPDSETAAPAQAECYAVAVALIAAASLVGGRPRTRPLLRTWGLVGLITVLGVRGLLGLTGRTSLVVPMATGPTFARLDRRLYGPLCLVLAGLTSRSLPRRSAAAALPHGP